MRIAVLGATGLTGRQLTLQALTRGHQVVVLARDPAKLDARLRERADTAQVDIHEPDSLSGALEGRNVDALVSGLGLRKGDPADTLVRGAEAVTAGGARHVVWLGALGSGASQRVTGPVIGPVIRLALRAELAAKVEADQHVALHGGTVVHAGLLTNREATDGYRLQTIAAAGRRWLMPSNPRADVAALMLDEAERPAFAGSTVVVAPHTET